MYQSRAGSDTGGIKSMGAPKGNKFAKKLVPKKVQYRLRLTDIQHKRLKALASLHRLTMSQLLINYIDTEFKKM
jgi:hypothetical protein